MREAEPIAGSLTVTTFLAEHLIHSPILLPVVRTFSIGQEWGVYDNILVFALPSYPQDFSQPEAKRDPRPNSKPTQGNFFSRCTESVHARHIEQKGE